MMSAMRDYVEPSRKIREIQGKPKWQKHAPILVMLVLLGGVFCSFGI